VQREGGQSRLAHGGELLDEVAWEVSEDRSILWRKRDCVNREELPGDVGLCLQKLGARHLGTEQAIFDQYS
jgi:hypothetical protein